MIAEQYVSFDTAKLLKEAGFDVTNTQSVAQYGIVIARKISTKVSVQLRAQRRLWQRGGSGRYTG